MPFRLDSVLIPCLSTVAPFRCPICGKPPFDGTPGMFCAECLEALPFIAEAVVSHDAGTAVITLSGELDEAAVKAAVEAKDFTFEGIE